MLRLKYERLRRNISQQKLGALAGIHPSIISHIENGKIYAFPGWRERIVKALNWPIEQADELFTEVAEDGESSL